MPPGADVLLRNEFIRGCATFLDEQFLGTAAEVENVSPGGLANGVTAIAASGTATAAANLKHLFATFTAANPDIESAAFIMSPRNAAAIAASMPGAAPNLGLQGGAVFGIPVVTSTAAADRIFLIDESAVLYADDNGLEVDVSGHAAVQLDSAPDNPSTASTVLIDLWSRNLVGVKLTRMITWKRARLSAVQFISGAVYA